MTIAILNTAKQLNAAVISNLHDVLDVCLSCGKTYRDAGMYNNANIQYAQARKYSVKLVKAVEKQKRIKVEIAAHFRVERIKRKYLKVFGTLPSQQIATSHEQEAMLDRLLCEKQANYALAISE